MRNHHSGRVSIVLLPHPPLLLPSLSGEDDIAQHPHQETGAGDTPLHVLRHRCAQALAWLISRPGPLLVVGAGPQCALHAQSASGSFRPYGVTTSAALLVTAQLPGAPRALTALRAAVAGSGAPAARNDATAAHASPPDMLPLSLTVAAWLLAGHRPRREQDLGAQYPVAPPATRNVGADEPPLTTQRVDATPRLTAAVACTVNDDLQRCRAIGTALGAAAGSDLRLLVMGDLAACHHDRGDKQLAEHANRFDRAVVGACRQGDMRALRDLKAPPAELQASCWGPLQVAAAALASHFSRDGDGDGRGDEMSTLQTEVLYDAAPFGVGYLVATLADTQGALAEPESSLSR